jgi:four helix bundle protein
MNFIPFNELTVYKLSVKLSDTLWKIVSTWESFSKNTLGYQLVRAADSIGANIAEGHGKESESDNRRYLRIARGSLNETRHFIQRASQRGLLAQSEIEELNYLLNNLNPALNVYLKKVKT